MHDSGSGWLASPFPVRLFHPLLHVGLSRRFRPLPLFPELLGIWNLESSAHQTTLVEEPGDEFAEQVRLFPG